ncbi:MAG: hypothetical protein K0B09_07995 [Bacteroidales bacterium]|nr:hypothetical protein [Bacteroidales bacterium]
MPFRFFLPLIFPVLMALASYEAFSQSQPVNFSFNQKVEFVPSPNAEQRITNDLLQHIADGSGRLRSMVSYQVEGRLQLLWQPGANGRQTGIVVLESLSISGDMHYRDFSLGRVLRPDLLRFEIKVETADGRVVFSQPPTNLQVGGVSNEVFRFETTRTNGNGLQASISGIHFSYSEATYQRLDQWFSYLEQYYAAAARLEEIYKDVENVDFSEPTTLILDEFVLCEAEGRMALLGRQGFIKGLAESAGDPEGVFEKIDQVQKRLTDLRTSFNIRMAVADSLLWVSGREWLSKGNEATARDRFENALVLNPFFVPAHLQLAELDLQQGKKHLAIQRLAEVFSVMFPSGEYREKALVLADTVSARFFAEAFNLNREGRFKESLDMLEPMAAFCEKTSGFIECPPELTFRLNQAHLGMYRSFLVVAGRSLRNDNLNLCQLYAASAIDYQRNNTSFIPDASEAFDVLQQATNRYVEMASQYFSDQEYLRASESYGSALDLCGQYSELYCPANLERRQQLALEMHERRREPTVSSAAYAADEPLVLPPLIGQPREELIEKIQAGQLMAWAGNLDGAREIQAEATTMSQRFRLSADPMIEKEFQKLNTQIHEKECELAGREIAAQLSRGLAFRKYGEWRLAAETGQGIIDLISAYNQCELRVSDSLRLLTDLAPVPAYLELLEEVLRSYRQSQPAQYFQVLEKYHEAERYFLINRLSELGLDHQPLAGFVSASGNIELVKATVEFTSSHPEFYAEEVIKLLAVMKNAGLSRNETRALQDLAGRKLAVYYRSKNPGQQVEPLLHSLTDLDPWFRFFEQAFLRYWRSY